MKEKSKLFRSAFASLLATVVLMTCITPALAVTYTEHASIKGSTGLFTVPGATWGDAWPADPDLPVKIEISFAHYDWGDHGPRDSITVKICRPPPSTYKVHVAWYTDTTQSAQIYRDVMTGPSGPYPTIIPVLKPWQIRICRIGKIVILRWTVPLEIESQTWYTPMGVRIQPAVTIPPGFVVLKGYGDPSAGGPSGGSKWSAVWTESYDACGFIMCPRWRRNAFVCLNTPGDTDVTFDMTVTSTFPDP